MALLFWAGIPVNAQERNLTVLELFTSQGCSSCPPADALLGVLAKRDDILALTLPVDYWDYIGWKDTFAKPQYTKRQRAYARSQNKFQIYTPQLMINGIQDAVGSNRREIETKIIRQQARENTNIDLVVKNIKQKFALSLKSTLPIDPKATLWVAAYQKKASVEIGRGENRGRTVTYTNVVHILKPIGTWSGESKSFEIAKKELSGKGINAAAIFLQKGNSGKIIAAKKLPF